MLQRILQQHQQSLLVAAGALEVLGRQIEDYRLSSATCRVGTLVVHDHSVDSRPVVAASERRRIKVEPQALVAVVWLVPSCERLGAV